MRFNVLKLKGLIISKKMSMTEFSEKIDVSRPTVSNYFNGRSKIDVDTIAKIANLFSVPISYFYDESENVDQVNEPQEAYTKKPKLIKQIELISNDLDNYPNTNENLKDQLKKIIK